MSGVGTVGHLEQYFSSRTVIIVHVSFRPSPVSRPPIFLATCMRIDQTRKSTFYQHLVVVPEQDNGVHLGGLEHLPDCRTLLIRKHIVEVERVMRLWRALVQQMRGQVYKKEGRENARDSIRSKNREEVFHGG